MLPSAFQRRARNYSTYIDVVDLSDNGNKRGGFGYSSDIDAVDSGTCGIGTGRASWGRAPHT
eukprot:SAG31_NODE_2327_length_5934_cov_7.878835_2_plen_62_part_00